MNSGLFTPDSDPACSYDSRVYGARPVVAATAFLNADSAVARSE
jgi:hypothetical protein